MQALTGLFARNFGTPNYAAHGGFCSVNMAAGMIYTIGGSFWEFGGPDLERAKLFVMIGTAEDHHSESAEDRDLASSSAAGGRFISINPVRTGYSAIADEWIPIRPGTDGALLHGAAARADRERPDRPRLPQALHQRAAAGGARTAASARACSPSTPIRRRARRATAAIRTTSWSGTERRHASSRPIPKASPTAATRRSKATTRSPTARRVAPVVPAAARAGRELHAGMGGRRSPASRPTRIRKLARELGDDRASSTPSSCRSPGPTPGASEHATTQARPVAFHAMRGLAAHSNGFQTVRALAVLMSVLGTIDAPGGFRHKAPYPRHIVPNYRAFNSPGDDQAEHAAQRGAARLSGQSGGAGGQPRRLADPHRPGVLLGASAVGARPDAQRDHQRGQAAIRTASTR